MRFRPVAATAVAGGSDDVFSFFFYNHTDYTKAFSNYVISETFGSVSNDRFLPYCFGSERGRERVGFTTFSHFSFAANTVFGAIETLRS